MSVYRKLQLTVAAVVRQQYAAWDVRQPNSNNLGTKMIVKVGILIDSKV